MAKGIAPPKQTGGGGYGFEDKVAAYYLACLLTNQPPFTPKLLGTLSRIDFQKRSDGWFMDDVLLTVRSGQQVHRVSLSVKSNRQITQGGVPADFIRPAWEQHLHEQTDIFNPALDFMGLVTSPLSPEVREQLVELQGWADGQDGKSLRENVARSGIGTDIKRSLFASLRCPDDLAKKHSLSEDNIGNLLQRLVFPEFDFDNIPSHDYQQAIALCRSALRSGDLNEAEELWNHLQGIARTYRPMSGYIDLRRLIHNLPSGIRLREFPQYQQDWNRLRNRTLDGLRRIRDTIGDQVSVVRSKPQDDLDKAFENRREIVLIGPSGSGKSVITKVWCERLLAPNQVLWFDAAALAQEDIHSLHSRWGLDNDFETLINATTEATAYVAIDALDRVISAEGFSRVATFLDKFHTNHDNSPWRLLVVTQEEEWERVSLALARNNIAVSGWHSVNVREPNANDLTPVWEAFPLLKKLQYQQQLHTLLLKPKVLDLLATKLTLGDVVDTSRWVGESDLIDWFWSSEVASQPGMVTRPNLLKELGEKQADLLKSEIPVQDLSDVTPLEGLMRDRLCILHEERVAFGHDLYADWSRQRLLLSKADSLREYLLPRLTSPMWNKAVRLYGLHLLEQYDNTDAWKAALENLASETGTSHLGQDLLLEGIIFAANPLPLLERLWPELSGQDGLLLKRLLGRFLNVATLPNPFHLRLAEVQDDPVYKIEAATKERLPYWPYWLPMLQFLYNHAADVQLLDPIHIAEIADTWLRRGREKWPLRAEIAQMALSIAEEVLLHEEDFHHRHHHKDLADAAYPAALAGIRELPDQVAEFALKACGRRERKIKRNVPPEYQPARRSVRLPFEEKEIPLPEPWSDGPVQHPSRIFERMCLDSEALYPIIEANPALAREVLLALLIETPNPRHPLLNSLPGRELGLKYNHEWYPPFYWHYPLYFFFRRQAIEAIDTVIRLVNFATDRWADRSREQGQQVPSIIIGIGGEQREWIGDVNVYYWYRDNTAPDVIASALMTLEQWLYEQVDNKQPIETYLKLIIDNATSVAFAGVLSAVGRKDQQLLRGPLRFLISVPELHFWERSYHARSHDYVMMSWIGKGPETIKAVEQWHSLSHRKPGIDTVSRILFFNDPEMRPFFEEMRAQWLERSKTAEQIGDLDTADMLERLAATYDVNNYSLEKHPEHGTVLAYNPPPEIADRGKDEAEQAQRYLHFMYFPIRCLEILDGKEALLEEGVEAFWIDAQSVAQMPQESGNGLSKREDAMCGAAAVLLLQHREWLKQHPDRERWCVDQILQTINNPPAPPLHDYEEADSKGQWHNFCARALPQLWAEDIASESLRGCIVKLMIDPHYKTVAALFTSAAARRRILQEDWLQLQHLARRWSVTRHEMNRLKYRAQVAIEAEQLSPVEHSIEKSHPSKLQKLLGRIQSIFSGLFHRRSHNVHCVTVQDQFQMLIQTFDGYAQAFVRGSLSPNLPSLLELGQSYPLPWSYSDSYHQDNERVRKSSGIDGQFIQSVYSWLPNLQTVSDSEERAACIHYWQEILQWRLKTLAPDEGDEEKEIDGLPTDTDRWVFKGVALLLGQMQKQEHPERFYEPILNLGSPGHHWVEDFLTDWFLYNLRQDIDLVRFATTWGAMVDYAFDAPGWKYSDNTYRPYLSELWHHLMGLDHIYRNAWVTEMQPAIVHMHSRFQRWAIEHLDSYWGSEHFAIFLCTPAADPILLDGIIWFSNIAEHKSGSSDWPSDSLQERLSRLLALAWQKHEVKMRQQPAAFDAFKYLLKILADRQNWLAIEIQNKIVS